MDLIRWSPLRDLDELFRGNFRTFESQLPSPSTEGNKWRPAANIVESDNEYTIRADLPEVKKDDIGITVDNGVLTISGERRVEKSSDEEKEHRRETFYGSFTRSFALPKHVDLGDIQAESKDDVLIVHVPKTKAETEVPVSIKVN